MAFDFFRKNKVVHSIVSSAHEIQENLDWTMNSQVPLRVTTESTTEHLDVRMAGVDHSPVDAYLLVRSLRPKEANALLKKKEGLNFEYESNRGTRFYFQSFPLHEIDPESGEFHVTYPTLIESFQEQQVARFKNISKDPIPVDVEMQRGIVIDIGLHGLKFTSNRIFEKGAVLKDLNINLPRYGSIQGSGVVKYLQSSTDYPFWRYLCGVEFTEMKPRDQRRLNRYVNRVSKQR